MIVHRQSRWFLRDSGWMLLTSALLGWVLLGSITAVGAAQLEDPIDLSLTGADLRQVLISFAQVANAEPSIHRRVQGRVTVELDDVSWDDAVNHICLEQSIHCELLHHEPPRLRVRPLDAIPGFTLQPGFQEPIDISLLGANLGQFFGALEAISGQPVEVASGVRGALTIHVRATPWSVVAEEVCQLHGCRIQWGDSLQVLPSSSISPRRGTLQLQGKSRAEALRLVAGLRIWGPFGPPVVEGADTVPGTVDVDLRAAHWVDLVEAICPASECQWSLHYGSPSRLKVEPPATEPQKGPVSEVAAPEYSSSEVSSSTDQPPPADTPNSPSPSAEPPKPGPTARAAGGTTGPPAGSEGSDLNVRLAAPGMAPIAADLRFSWTSPIAAFAAGDRRLHLSWIPLAPGRELVLPIFEHCANGEDNLHVVPPLFVADLPGGGRWGNASFTLRPTEVEKPRPARSAAEMACRRPGRGHLEARLLSPTPGTPEGQTITLDLPARLGSYLRIVPPTADVPSIAVATLGLEVDDSQRVVVVTLDDTGESTWHEVVLEPDQAHRRAVTDGVESMQLELVYRAGN